MRKQVLVLCVILACTSCKEVTQKETATLTDQAEVTGQWDNFLQYWQENTGDDIHRVEVNEKHNHYHLNISEQGNDSIEVTISKGRNGKDFVEKMKLSKEDSKEAIRVDADTLFVLGLEHFENMTPYRFMRARTFSGWLEYPMQQYQDSVYRLGNLEIHDQGGMAEIDIEGVQYTAELTQLVYGKRLAIMKLAIYDMPLDSVKINSKSISYTWVNPEAKRIGINLRKIITGWTLIEPGFQNQNTWRKEKE